MIHFPKTATSAASTFLHGIPASLQSPVGTNRQPFGVALQKIVSSAQGVPEQSTIGENVPVEVPMPTSAKSDQTAALLDQASSQKLVQTQSKQEQAKIPSQAQQPDVVANVQPTVKMIVQVVSPSSKGDTQPGTRQTNSPPAKTASASSKPNQMNSTQSLHPNDRTPPISYVLTNPEVPAVNLSQMAPPSFQRVDVLKNLAGSEATGRKAILSTSTGPVTPGTPAISDHVSKAKDESAPAADPSPQQLPAGMNHVSARGTAAGMVPSSASVSAKGFSAPLKESVPLVHLISTTNPHQSAEKSEGATFSAQLSSSPNSSLVPTKAAGPPNLFAHLDSGTLIYKPGPTTGAKTLEVTLHDQSTSVVDVQARLTAGVVAASIHVKSAAESIGSVINLPKMQEFLAEHNVNLGNLSLTFSHGDSSRSGEEQNQTADKSPEPAIQQPAEVLNESDSRTQNEDSTRLISIRA